VALTVNLGKKSASARKTRKGAARIALWVLAAATLASVMAEAESDWPWRNRSLPAAQRSEMALAQMSESEKLLLVRGVLGARWGGRPKPAGAIGSAGYVEGIPRLGVPALQETDAELGVTDPGNVRPGDGATAMPSNLALASTWDVALARWQGEAVGAEARAKGFNILLGGAANLIRDPRGGRDFEYFSEDPLLTGLMAGAQIAGAQSRGVISTVKHFALNAQETDRVVLDARIDPAAARESDLLAFEIAIERGRPGAVMCAYNQVNGVYSCENKWLLGEVLKTDWRYPGFVMSDWGAVHSAAPAANAGLDQESGDQLDTENFFERPLATALANGAVPQWRLDDMARRILTSMFDHGLCDGAGDSSPPDLTSSDRTALDIEREAIALLKNDGLLPLSKDPRTLAVIGAHADRGVPSGGGSSQVAPRGGVAAKEQIGRNRAEIFDPGSPLEAIRREFLGARVEYDDGRDVARAARLAARADVVVLFAQAWRSETFDAAGLDLPDGQDQLIEAVAHANPRTVVALETGGPVLMPWLNAVAAIVEAWYPGQQGAQAIAEILSGAVNPSGRLPVTFPMSETQLPHPKIQGDPRGAPIGPVGRGKRYGRVFVANYGEGAAVGYKWFFERRERALFPFGFGLSYTAFRLSGLAPAASGNAVTASLSVKNEGNRAGVATVQVYVSGPPEVNIPLRLAGWSRIDLAPGEERRVSVAIDPRLFARFDEAARRWRIAPGVYRLTAGFDAERREENVDIALGASDLPP
jgi:beta-glucosidase